MTDIILFYSTAPNETAAQALAKKLIEADAAACVNILPGVRSVYRWRGATEENGEVAMIIKANATRADDVKTIVLEAHPYDNPALIALRVDRERSSEKFCAWIENPD